MCAEIKKNNNSGAKGLNVFILCGQPEFNVFCGTEISVLRLQNYQINATEQSTSRKRKGPQLVKKFDVIRGTSITVFTNIQQLSLTSAT